jgi:hypothetical protein
MAQADSVPSSSRQLITGESASKSISVRAVSLPAVRVQPVDRRSIVGGSHAPAIIGTDEAPLRLWRKKRNRGVEQDPLKSRSYGAKSGPAPMGPNMEALFHSIAVFLRKRLPNLIVLILLQFVKRLRVGALDKVSSNQLIHQSHRRISGEHSGRTKSSEIESFGGHQEPPPLLHRRLGRPHHHGGR